MKKKIKIIAEAGCNHNGKLRLAFRLVNAAKKAGADAIKFQLFNPDKLVVKNAPKADYAKKFTRRFKNQYEMQKKISLSYKQHLKLKKYCEKKKIEYLCSAFDIESLNVLRKFKLKTYKVPSGEINNVKYLRHLGGFKKNILLSTGMSSKKEIIFALKILKDYGTSKDKIIILQCNSEYPSPYRDINLRAMASFKKEFNCDYGFSDHSLGIEVPIAAAALGAKVIEKHFTLNKKYEGPDHHMSLIPKELEQMITSIRNVEKALGKKTKIVTKSEKKNIKVARKSIVARLEIKAGEKFTIKNLTIKRPGNGIPANKYFNLIGRKSKRIFKKDELITR
jgi:N,N'-diacetyllegionaminate synthase